MKKVHIPTPFSSYLWVDNLVNHCICRAALLGYEVQLQLEDKLVVCCDGLDRAAGRAWGWGVVPQGVDVFHNYVCSK